MRYSNQTKEKTHGVVYTPTEMADYLADQMIRHSIFNINKQSIVRVLDPAVGEGELLIAMIRRIKAMSETIRIYAVGYETDSEVATKTQETIQHLFPDVRVSIICADFLESIETIGDRYDYIIANPPYIRTQILGTNKAQEISQKMGLSGRVDIYYAFLLCMKQILSDEGISGYITSNKFLTIKAGASVRDFMIENYRIHSIVDFGDTKLFSASVLPCIVVFSKGTTTNGNEVCFTSVYESKDTETEYSCRESVFDFITENGRFGLPDGRVFDIRQGTLKEARKGELWVIASNEQDEWLRKVDANTWQRFADIGKIRVGIKTTADNVFIGDNWSGENADLELLRPLITHRDAGQIVPKQNMGWKVLYTHTVRNGKKVAVDIEQYPKSKRYLLAHYDQLAGRKYVQEANRNWYEIWVPQNPASWEGRKIVFRDISEKPEFWLDLSGAIVNGDCYWIEIDKAVFDETVYLALAIANSSFIERYYDVRFNTKLYSGKRRYMSQYVELFPIPYPHSALAQEAIDLVQKIISGHDASVTSRYKEELDSIVDKLFDVN